VIIWSRWGFLVLLPLGLGAATGSLLAWIVVPGEHEGGLYSVFLGLGIVLGGFYTYLFDRYVIDRYLDKPRQHVVLEPLAQPVGGQTHRQVPLVHPETGLPVVSKPRSTLFFIPTRYWPVIFVVLGALVLFLSAISAFGA
jgi:hypothetical protein